MVAFAFIFLVAFHKVLSIEYRAVLGYIVARFDLYYSLPFYSVFIFHQVLFCYFPSFILSCIFSISFFSFPPFLLSILMSPLSCLLLLTNHEVTTRDRSCMSQSSLLLCTWCALQTIVVYVGTSVATPFDAPIVARGPPVRPHRVCHTRLVFTWPPSFNNHLHTFTHTPTCTVSPTQLMRIAALEMTQQATTSHAQGWRPARREIKKTS